MYVIKIGGGAAIDEAAYARFADDLALLHEAGKPFVVVHGGNAEFSRLSAALGMPPRMITNDKGRVSRYTDRETIDAMLMTYCGKVNKTIVATFQQAGINAVGLSAIDGRIATGRRKPVLRGTEDGKPKVLRDDHAGSIETIDTALISLLLANGYVPVLTPPALAVEEGRPINVDGDKLALNLARDLSADALLFFSDTPGLLADKDDESTLIREIDASDPANALASARGRMVVKVEQALKAIEHGVGQVIFGDARVEYPVQRALAGEGTRIGVPVTSQ
ncbi:MAG TPA: [LysW]-aminoadipate kinase [Thermomicrobiales bacterium]|jgi:acetylglutamate/LysW-gamma-L-alpha-aminoadipate kinase|nr:[LysW]-aminoadipate kinase [Thermomicrobiales bacterium]